MASKDPNTLPETRFAQSGDVSIAYQVMGDGPANLIIVPGIISHVEAMHEFAGHTDWLRRLARFARVVTFDKRGQGLSDRVVAVQKPKFLCVPTDKNNEDPSAPNHAEHLEGYQIKPAAKRELPTNLTVKDQFNSTGLVVDAKKESHLLVPTVKSLSGPPALPSAFEVDHFQCYKANVSKGAPKFTPVSGVPIEDQFGTLVVDVKKPRYLCVPVDKKGEGIRDANSHLMCYQIKQAKDDPKFTKVVGAYVNNQFGSERLDVKAPAELCVPATLVP